MRPVLLVLCLSCAPTLSRYVFLPKTAEAGKCRRECLQIEATCESRPMVSNDALANAIGRANLETHCEREHLNCLHTCPGAVEVSAESYEAAVALASPAPSRPPPLVSAVTEDFAPYAGSQDAGGP